MTPSAAHWLLRRYAECFNSRCRPDDLLHMKCDVQLALRPLSLEHQEVIFCLYTKGLSIREVMKELSVDRRLLLRLRSEALKAIAEYLGDEYEAWVPLFWRIKEMIFREGIGVKAQGMS